MNINDYFQRTFIINLRRRADRRALAFTELAASGIDPLQIEWVEGFDHPTSGNEGCSKSHRDLIRRIATGPHERVLVIEDDFKTITMDDLLNNGFREYPGKVMEAFRSVLDGQGNLNERFTALIPFLPETFSVLYLAAGYGEPPISRFNQHVLRVGFMQTTGTYGITRDFARRWTEIVDARNGDNYPGPIDNLFGSMAHDHLYYCLQPRLAFQRESKSDLNGQAHSYLLSMTDPVAESTV